MTSMASSIEPSITVRKAEHDDYETVLGINKNVYDGCDYIPIYYHDLIDDQDFHFYVVVVDGNVAAFEGVILLDDRKTLMTRSARVKESYKGMGLLKQIRKKIHEEFKNISSLQSVRTSCTYLVRLVDSKTFRQENRTLLRKEVICFEATFKDLLAHENICQKGAKEITLTQFSHLLDEEHLKCSLFPDGIFTTSSWFFDKLVSNMKYLEKLLPTIVITEPLYRYLQPDSSIEPCDVNPKKITYSSGLLGISHHYFCFAGILYDLDISGTLSEGKEEDETLPFLMNFVNHLKTVFETRKNVTSAIFVLNLPEGTSQEWIRKALPTLGFKLSELDCRYMYQYYFEQDFGKLIE